jgi:hypothetical protein
MTTLVWCQVAADFGVERPGCIIVGYFKALSEGVNGLPVPVIRMISRLGWNPSVCCIESSILVIITAIVGYAKD